MMKAIVFILVLSALIGTSYSAPTAVKDEPADEPIKKVIFTDGKKGPGDYRLASFSTKRKPNNLEISPDDEWDYSKDNAHISYIDIVQVGSTNATASITSGGVGTNHLTFKAIASNGDSFHFMVDVWGTLTE